MVQIVEWGGKEGDGVTHTQGKQNRVARKSTKLTGKTNRMEEHKKKTEWGKKKHMKYSRQHPAKENEPGKRTE